MIMKQYTYGIGNSNTIQPNAEIIANDFEYATEIGIYGLPGTKFKVDEIGEIVLNGSGLLTFGRDDYPIKKLTCTNLTDLYSNNTTVHCLIINVVGEAK